MHERKYDFNRSEEWQAFAASYERIILAIATKFCTADEQLAEDVAQECRIALATIRPERVAGYNRADLTREERHGFLDRYVRNVARNAALSYLDSYSTGPWNIGRTRASIDRHTGEKRKIHLPSRFSSFDMLSEEHGLDIDTEGHITWAAPGEDGLLSEGVERVPYKPHFLEIVGHAP